MNFLVSYWKKRLDTWVGVFWTVPHLSIIGVYEAHLFRRFGLWKIITSRGNRMNTTARQQSWVVYQMTIPGNPKTMRAVCEQREWEALQSAQPAGVMLLQAGIVSEAEAEKLARHGPVTPKKVWEF